MKILVFEYISGGGLAGQVLPASLAAEGRMMLQTLLDELKILPNIELLLPLDERCHPISIPENCRVFRVGPTDDIQLLLANWIAETDIVWPIAPETDGLLVSLAQLVQNQHKTLLLSDPETVALCTDKLLTYRCLAAHGIAAVETQALTDLSTFTSQGRVIKLRDGAGCEGNRIIYTQQDFNRIMHELQQPERHVIQPLLAGPSFSLSCLFKQGLGWLLCSNFQEIFVQDQQFHLQACLVNNDPDACEKYQALINQIASALPGLWGYIGIDLIQSPQYGPQILEINPRLTTSYTGIRQATGINVAEQVLHLLEGQPSLAPTQQRTLRIDIG